jgi:Cysteine rich repeat
MRSTFIAAALAASFIFGSTAAVNAMGGGCHPLKPCAVDLNSLCTDVTPGEGRLAACLKARMADLSTSCSTVVSREVYVATACEADLKHFCAAVQSGGGRIVSCMQPHFGEVSSSCRGAPAFVDAPGNIRQ